MKPVTEKWPEVAVEDFAEVITGGTPSTLKSEYWKGGSIPWLNSGELNKGIIYQADNFITEEGLENSSAKMMPENTVLVALTGATTGVSALLKTRACGNQSVTGILPSQKHNSCFLFRFMQFIRPKIIAESYGGAQKHISQAYIKKLRIPLPSVEEQKRIAMLLDEADELRKLRAQADRRTAALIPALFHEMFGDPLGGRHKWPEVKFEEVTRRITYGFTCPMKHLKSGIPIITCKNVLDGQIDFQNVHYADSGEFEALTAKSKPERNDILITKDGTIGRCAVVDVDFPLCINQSVALIQLKLEKVTPIFLSHYILFPSVNAFLNGMGKGQALKHLQITELAKMPIPSPPMALQKEFALRVSEIREVEAAQSSSHQRLDDLFQSMLHRAFNGDL